MRLLWDTCRNSRDRRAFAYPIRPMCWRARWIHRNRLALTSISRRWAHISGRGDHQRQGQAAHCTIHHLAFYRPHLQINTARVWCMTAQPDSEWQSSSGESINSRCVHECAIMPLDLSAVLVIKGTAWPKIKIPSLSIHCWCQWKVWFSKSASQLSLSWTAENFTCSLLGIIQVYRHPKVIWKDGFYLWVFPLKNKVFTNLLGFWGFRPWWKTWNLPQI